MTKKTSDVQKIFQRITFVYLCLMFSVFILWPGTVGYEDIQGAKFTLFLILCAGYVIVTLVCAGELVLVGEWKPGSPLAALKRTSWTQRLVLLYVVLTWVSALLSPYFPGTVLGTEIRGEGALTITLYGLCFLLVSLWGRVTKQLPVILSAVICALCVLCLIQFAGGNPLGLYPEGLSYLDAGVKYSGAYLGTIGNVDLLAALFCLAIPVLWIALIRLSGGKRFLLLAPLALSVIVLIKMSVSAGFVGVVFGGLICLPFVLPLSGKKRLAVGLAVVIIIAAACLILKFQDFGVQLLHEIHEVLNGNADESFGSGRLRIWADVLREVPAHLLFGYGPDTMAYGDIEAFTRYDEALGGTLVSHVDVAHNEYLNILYHQGVLALGAYIGALVTAFVRFVKTSAVDGMATLLGGAVICYLVQAFFGISSCITAPLFWIALGLLEQRVRKV